MGLVVLKWLTLIPPADALMHLIKKAIAWRLKNVAIQKSGDRAARRALPDV
jgi:hypothetical protein